MWSITLLALALCLMSLPAMAQQTFFDDLGSGNNLYNGSTGWTISGTSAPPGSFTTANEFTSLASGSVSEIDVAVSYVAGFQNSSFYAAIYTVGSNGTPGTELWSETDLTSNQQFGGCCGLVSLTGITGLTLSAGESYFIVLGPADFNSNTYAVFNWNSTGATGVDEFSRDNGQTWTSNGVTTIGAFDIVGGNQPTVPEPSSLLLLGSGLVGAFTTMRKKMMR